MIPFLTDGPEYKRKRAMILKKDLSFSSLRFIPFLGLHSLHGAQLVGSQKPTGFLLIHVIELSIYMAANSIGAFLFKHQKEKKLKTTP